MRKFLNLALIALLTTVACNSEKPKEATDLLSDSLINSKLAISESNLKELMSAVPNPMETALILKSVNFSYSDAFLNPFQNVKNYTTNFKKALNMGVYGTDLVFMNVNEKTNTAVSYIDNIKTLANDIKVGQFFDHNTLNRLNDNSKNTDSVLFITSSGFDKMTQYLQNQKRNNLSVLVSVGTWVETMYFATKYQTVSDKSLIFARIGEQKVVVDKIIILLNVFKDNSNFKSLYDDFNNLKKEYDKVIINYTFEKPTIKEKGDGVVITDNSSSTVKIEKENVDNIAKIITEIRNKIIS